MKKLFSLILFFIYSFAYAADLEGDTARFRAVDKVTGHTATFNLTVGKPTNHNNMRLSVERCLTKPADETPENAAYILIEEKKDETYQVIFNGWMFSSNPALSAMEHPIFDIWLLSCNIKEEKEPVNLVETVSEVYKEEDNIPTPSPNLSKEGEISAEKITN